MPMYSSAQALLSDARLRIDQLGGDTAVMVVEGPDDKRLFSRLTANRQQVLVAGGRRLLLSSHELSINLGYGDVVFLTDCDYEILMGQLELGSQSLVVTTYADVEADLVALGALRNVVAELVPDSTETDEKLDDVTEAVLNRSVVVAEALGRARYVGRRGGFQVRTDIHIHRHREAGSENVDTEKLYQTIVNTSPECTHDIDVFRGLIDESPDGYTMCNGHDLAAAVNQVLRDDFGVRNQTPESIEMMLRHGVRNLDLLPWEVIKRLQNWETDNGRSLFDRRGVGSIGTLLDT